MAREYARIMTSIWRNQEFRDLSEAQQRAYLMLVCQPDISAAGVLPLRMKRWADMASTSSVDSLAQVFKELEVGRYIAVDWDLEELLIRSFIRWDGGFNNPKRRPVIVKAAEEVDSPLLSRLIAQEFKRCGIDPLPDPPTDGPGDSPSDSDADSLSDSASKIDKVNPGNEPFPQVNSLFDTHAASEGRVPQPTTHNPQPIPPTAGASADAPTAQTLVGEWIDLCPKRPPSSVIGQTSKNLKALLADGIDPDDIRAGLRTWSAKGLHPSTLGSVVNEVMNARPRLHMIRGGGNGPYVNPDESEYDAPMFPQENR